MNSTSFQTLRRSVCKYVNRSFDRWSSSLASSVGYYDMTRPDHHFCSSRLDEPLPNLPDAASNSICFSTYCYSLAITTLVLFAGVPTSPLYLTRYLLSCLFLFLRFLAAFILFSASMVVLFLSHHILTPSH
jgi:hypothetical protein